MRTIHIFAAGYQSSFFSLTTLQQAKERRMLGFAEALAGNRLRRRLSLRMDNRNVGPPFRLFRSHGSLSVATPLMAGAPPPIGDMLDVCLSPNTLSPQSLSPSSPKQLSMLRSESPTEGYGCFKQVKA
jgi:hypothetical protein